jgi:hypothetical protein
VEILPQWTSKVDKRGLDPLGMQNSGVVLYQALLPGISNITLRMRYYGFYCWLSETYAQRGVTTDFELWRRWVRRAEALYSLVSANAGGEGGVGGVDWAGKRLALNEKIIDFAEAASNDANVTRYLLQSLGVFGAAYYTQMVEMGLFEEGPNGIQRLTADIGVAAARAFRASIDDEIETSLIEAIDTAKVSRTMLEKLQPIAPSEIPDPSEERTIYEKVLFAAGAKQEQSDRSRSASLSLILGTAVREGAMPTPEIVRWFLFDPDHDDLPADIEAQRLLWEVYQCQDLFQVAAAGLLAWAISMMGELDEGRTLAEIQSETVARITEMEPDQAALLWAQFRDEIDPDTFDWRGAWTRLVGRRGSAEEKAWDAVALMAALHQRMLAREDLFGAMRTALPQHGNARSIATELRWLEQEQNATVAELIGTYIGQRVILRHSWVAMQKLRRQRDYTFLFEVRDGRLVRLNGYQPVATTPRLAPAIKFLEDVHLVADDGLTARGRALLGANQ